jgi:integrase
MAKIPYLVRRKNIYYFRLRVPAELQSSIKVREFIISLKTENRAEAIPHALKLAAHFKASMQDVKNGKANCQSIRYESPENNPTPATIQSTLTAPLLSFIVDDFLKRYDPANKSMLGKLTGTLPVLIELVGDKPINQILQCDINNFFDEVQKLPVRRDAAKFKGMSLQQIITANSGPCIAEKTFKSTYRACVSVFVNWANVHYKDQGFPNLSTQGAVYRGKRADGINKQRALKPDELQRLFGHEKMKSFAADPETSHYCWLPLIGLHTGARINEICQLNPFTDIAQEKETGVHYFRFTDEGETAAGVDKSIKTNSSKRIVPIHSALLELGFLDYVGKMRAGGHKVLFPQWEPRGGKASANAAKWFVRYLESIGLRDDSEGARLSGFHSFRHTFITHGMVNKIQGLFAITGHEVEMIDGMGKISTIAKGYWTRGITDDILEKQTTIEKFNFRLTFYKPSL